MSLDTTFSRFLDESFTWKKKTATKPYRGLADNPKEATDSQSKILKKCNFRLITGIDRHLLSSNLQELDCERINFF